LGLYIFYTLWYKNYIGYFAKEAGDEMLQMNPTTKQLLEYLKKHDQVCVNALCDELQITHMAVRKHLNKLEKDNLISANQVKQAMGRPVTLYQLTEKGKDLFPKKYDMMTVEMLEDLEALDGREKVDLLFERREERLRQKYGKRIKEKETFQERVKELQDIQINNGYMVETKEMNDQEIEFIEYNCPIFQVANKYKKACDCELSLFKELLGANSIERTACMSDGDHRCRYVMKNSDST
jgi:iron-sulfur cluster biosynthesis transcriptional regulator SufR